MGVDVKLSKGTFFSSTFVIGLPSYLIEGVLIGKKFENKSRVY